MSVPTPKQQEPHDAPKENHLRLARDAAQITRVQLSMRCRALADTDPTSYTAISVNAIRDLEVGRTKPRRSTAVTLAAALKSEIELLFPGGIDTPLRNPDGRTFISPNRRKGGRPPKA